MTIKQLKYKLKKILFYFQYNLTRRIRILFNIDQKTLINDLEIVLPPEHLLTLYNYIYPKYDTFLPKLVSNIDKNMSVIDIGANVGDTLVRLIASNPKLNYYSIEADEYFYLYLKKNNEKFKINTQTKIKLIKELVGLDLVGYLKGTSSGTKSLVESNDGLKTKKLDEIILEHNINNIALIKVDVDGYDYNVLLSGLNQIKKHKPVLFFEYIYVNELGYIHVINKLNEIGYKNWAVLNNYGTIIFENKSYVDILNLIKSETKNNVVLDIYCKWMK